MKTVNVYCIMCRKRIGSEEVPDGFAGNALLDYCGDCRRRRGWR